MNFDQAIAAHSQWKTKLASYLKNPDHSLKPSEVSMGNRCELGKWIASEGLKYSVMPEFRTLKEEHARFHKAAADVVRRADLGEQVSEEMALGSQSEFRSASKAVVQAIMSLREKAR